MVVILQSVKGVVMPVTVDSAHRGTRGIAAVKIATVTHTSITWSFHCFPGEVLKAQPSTRTVLWVITLPMVQNQPRRADTSWYARRVWRTGHIEHEVATGRSAGHPASLFAAAVVHLILWTVSNFCAI